MTEINEEIGKYRKKAESNTSKANRKANHKHTYEECLLLEGNRPYHASYCSICGKIYNIAFFETKALPNGTYQVLDNNEVFAKYKNLPQFHIETIWDKYINL